MVREASLSGLLQAPKNGTNCLEHTCMPRQRSSKKSESFVPLVSRRRTWLHHRRHRHHPLILLLLVMLIMQQATMSTIHPLCPVLLLPPLLRQKILTPHLHHHRQSKMRLHTAQQRPLTLPLESPPVHAGQASQPTRPLSSAQRQGTPHPHLYQPWVLLLLLLRFLPLLLLTFLLTEREKRQRRGE